MRTVTVISSSTALVALVEAAVVGVARVLHHRPHDRFDFASGGSPGPDAWLVDAGPGESEALIMVRQLAGHGGAPVLLAGRDPAALALPALRAGASDVVDPAGGPDEVRRQLEHLWTARTEAATSRSGAAGRVIAVVSPKGGVGKTTAATNLAVGLARAAPNETVLVDLDVQFGDVASALDLRPDHTLVDCVHGSAASDSMVLKTYLTLHSTGLFVICGPETPVEADAVSADDVGRLLTTLAQEFRYVVVDTAPGMSDHTLAVMDRATELVLITSMDVPGLRGLRKELDTLAELPMVTGQRHVVLNLVDPVSGLTQADAEATIGTEVDLSLPRSTAVPASVNRGVPLLQSGGKDPVTLGLSRLVSRFAAAPDPGIRGRRRRRVEPRRAASRLPRLRPARPVMVKS